MKTSKLFAILFMIFFLSSIVYTGNLAVLADGDEEDETSTDEEDETKTEDEDDEDEKEEEEKERAYDREVKIEREADKVKIESELKTGESKDKIEFEFKSDDSIEFQLKYKTESDSAEIEMKFKVKFKSIVEYLENGTTTGYQKGEEVFKYKLEDQDFDDITYEMVTVDTVDTHIFSVSTSDGVFTAIIKISGSLALDGETTLTPNSLKIDIVIENFPYTAADSSLALESRLKTKFHKEVESDTDEEAAGFTSGESAVSFGESGFFSWADTADADGTTIDVVTSTIIKLEDDDDEDEHEEGDEETETEEKMFFSFVTKGAAKIYWDPRVGVVSEGTAALLQDIAAGSALPGFDIFTALIAFMAILSLGFRRKFKK